ncbi:HEPN domain-containing protein [Roseibium album]|uniref:HEPN domain-containing protein n=1 Tax=Roseibium album TaxID=311410 RepID=UPI0024906ACF|nr:HEPN domain-containing protein [Roseibium album]
MLPLRTVKDGQRIDALITTMDEAVGDLDVRIQNVLANHVVLAASGYVEQAVVAILSEYGRQHGNQRISRFVEKMISRQNSLNCDKIEKILNHFDKSWWPKLENSTASANISAVDSLKTLRDQIAHGKPNGTGYITVKDYYEKSKKFVSDFAVIINQ